MNKRFLGRILMGALLAGATTLASVAWAQTESNPAKILVGFAAGGSFDSVARQLAERLKQPLGRAVIVDSRPGAAGRIAMGALKLSPPDGSVAMICPDFLISIYPSIFKNLPYDPATDVVPVSMVASYAMAVAVPASSPIKTFPEYVAWLNSHPAAASYGHGGVGAPPYFLGLRLGKLLKKDLQEIGYKGASLMLADLMGGQIPFGVSTVADFLEAHKAGKIRILAVTSPQRSPLLPTVPTFAELGLNEMTASGLIGICVPPKTPPAVIAQWNSAVRVAVAQESFASVLHGQALEVRSSSPEEMRQQFIDTSKYWGAIIRDSGYKPE